MYFKAISICCLWGLPVIIYFFYLNICGKTLAAGNLLRKWKNLKLIYVKSDVFGGWWNSYNSKDLTDIGYERWNRFSTVMEQKNIRRASCLYVGEFLPLELSLLPATKSMSVFHIACAEQLFQAVWTDTVKGKLQQ